jgi:hypothetical protein
MAGSVSLNPALVTNAAGLFSSTTKGMTQGTAYGDSSIRKQLVSGIVSPSATTPMWGGEAVTESLWTPGVENSEIGSILTLATAEANVSGFTVFDQSSAGYISPQSPVALYPAGCAINFYRLGSRARIAVPVSSVVAADLIGLPTYTPVYWDYTNQVLLFAPGGTARPVKVVGLDNVGNSKVVVYNSGTQFATWNMAGFCAVIEI